MQTAPSSFSPKQEGLFFKSLAWNALPGWQDASFEDAHDALTCSRLFFKKGAQSWANAHAPSSLEAQGWLNAFDQAIAHDLKTNEGFRTYLEATFQPYQLVMAGDDMGLFTGYYHPHVEASRVPTPEHTVPIYKRPPELVMIEDAGLFMPTLAGQRLAGVVKDGALVPYFTRAQINAGALRDRELEIAWAHDVVDVFFMMVQGSGTLLFEDNTTLTLHYAGANGHPYTSLGKELIAQNAFDAHNASAQSVRDWLKTHTAQALEMMERNKSYIFFAPSPQNNRPYGALGSVLTPMRSLACDPHNVPLGAPLWISTSVPWQDSPWQQLLFAQDVGSAIKGGIRGDLYCGPGQRGAALASALNHQGNLFILWPKTLAPPRHVW